MVTRTRYRVNIMLVLLMLFKVYSKIENTTFLFVILTAKFLCPFLYVGIVHLSFRLLLDESSAEPVYEL